MVAHAFLATPIWEAGDEWWKPIEFDELGHRHPAVWPQGFDSSTLKPPAFKPNDRVRVYSSTRDMSIEGVIERASLMGGPVPGYLTRDRAIRERYFVQPKYIVRLDSGVEHYAIWEYQLEPV